MTDQAVLDVALHQNRPWPAYAHPTCEHSEPAGVQAVVGPERFFRWTHTDMAAAVELYNWARDIVNSHAFPICPWPGRRLTPQHWSLAAIVWDEGLLRIEALRPRPRPTLAHPVQYHHWSWTGRHAQPPPVWPWATL